MLGEVLRKIEAGEFDFNPRELKIAVPYAPYLLQAKPELIEPLLEVVSESQRTELMLRCLQFAMPQNTHISAFRSLKQVGHEGETEKKSYDPTLVNRIIRQAVEAGEAAQLSERLVRVHSHAMLTHCLSSSLEEVQMLGDALSKHHHGEHMLGNLYLQLERMQSAAHLPKNPEVEAYFEQHYEKMLRKEGAERPQVAMQHARHPQPVDHYRDFAGAVEMVEFASKGSIKDAKKLLKNLQAEAGRTEQRFFLRGPVASDILSAVVATQNWEFGSWFLDQVNEFGGRNDLTRLLQQGINMTAHGIGLSEDDAFMMYLGMMGGGFEYMPRPNRRSHGAEAQAGSGEEALSWVLKQARERGGKELVRTITEQNFTDIMARSHMMRKGLGYEQESLESMRKMLTLIQEHGGKKAARNVLLREMNLPFKHGGQHQVKYTREYTLEYGAPQHEQSPDGKRKPQYVLRLHPSHFQASPVYIEQMAWILEQAEALGGEGTAKHIIETQILPSIGGGLQRKPEETFFMSAQQQENRLFGVLELSERFGGKAFANEALQCLSGPNARNNAHHRQSEFLPLIVAYCANGRADAAIALLDRIEAKGGPEAKEDILNTVLMKNAHGQSFITQQLCQVGRRQQLHDGHADVEDNLADAVSGLCEVFGNEVMKHVFQQKSELTSLFNAVMQTGHAYDPNFFTEFMRALREVGGEAFANKRLAQFAVSDHSPLRSKTGLEVTARALCLELKGSEAGLNALQKLYSTQSPEAQPDPHYPDAPSRQLPSPACQALKIAWQNQPHTVSLVLEIVNDLEGKEGVRRVVDELFGDNQRNLAATQGSRYAITALVSTLVSIGAKDVLGTVDEKMLPSDVRRVLGDESLSKHDLLQEIGSGDVRWMAVFNKPAPHLVLKDCSPLKFSGKLYEQALPLMQTACNVERNRGAVLNAYKLAVMFSSMQEAERYLDRFATDWGADSHQPVHDALLFDVPKQGRWNPLLWKDLLLKYGPAASKYMGLAPRIEAYIAEEELPFPQSPAELKAIAANVAYERARENPELARLALGLGMGELRFNNVLDEMLANQKTQDHLPDIFIDGADIGHPGFYMEKLAIGDPRGLFLGELTNCCQSIGGAASGCAKHGFSSEDGGFYVWKHKTKGQITPDDTIVAQSWVWRGEDNALVFDSFERLGSAYNKLAQPFIQQLAYEVQDHTFPNDETGEPDALTAVRLGTSGNTPKMDFVKVNDPSIPRGHRGYRDSNSQYEVVPLNQRKEKPSAEVVDLASWAAREQDRVDQRQQRANGRG